MEIELRKETKKITKKQVRELVEHAEAMFDMLDSDAIQMISLKRLLKEIHPLKSNFWDQDRIKKAEM